MEKDIKDVTTESTVKNDAQLAGRVPQEDRDFVYSIIDKEKGETFATALKKLIDAYKSTPIETSGLDFSKEMQTIKSTVDGISKIVDGVKAQAELYVKDKISEANMKLDAKDEALKNVEIEYLNYIKKIESEKEIIMQENAKLKEDVSTLIDTNKTKEKIIFDLDKANRDKDKVISGLETEKTKLLSEVTEHAEKTIELQAKVNSQLHMEKENEVLRKEISELKVTSNIKDNTIESKDKEIEKQTKYVESLENEIKSLDKELDGVKNEYRETVSNLTLKHKEEIIDTREKVKEELDKKYESKIDEYKTELFSLKLQQKAEKVAKNKNNTEQ